MHICPECNKPIVGISKKKTLNRYTRYCPHCGVLLRKKFSMWFVGSIVLFGVTAANLKTHWAFDILAVLSAVLVVFVYSKLPYERYDR